MNTLRHQSLRQVALNRDVYELTDRVSDEEELILHQWETLSREDFKESLVITSQHFEEAKLAFSDLDITKEYQLGRLEGAMDIIRSILKSEEIKDNLIEAAAQHSTKIHQIIKCLYEAEGNSMRHGELAEAIGSSNSSLSNIMKRVLISGAVNFSRAGKNTYYTLSHEGKNYWEKTQSTKNKMSEIDFILRKLDSLEDKLQALQSGNMNKEDNFKGGIPFGTKFIPYYENKFLEPVTLNTPFFVQDKIIIKLTKDSNVPDLECDLRKDYYEVDLATA